ncbi:MAG: cytochrome c-type biogenesis protein [Paracoccaceae bacterium]|jgi:cytochrome c-type biogenesis protein
MLFDVSHYGAFLAGLLSFLSPCILPIVPFYLSYLAGITMNQFTDAGTLNDGSRRRVVMASVFFAAGIITVFTGLGAAASAFGQLLTEYFIVLRYIAGSLIIVMGLHFLGVFKVALLYREARIEPKVKPVSLIGAYVVGLAFAFGWTPCVGPILAAILFAAGAQDSVAQGTTLLLAYGVGMTFPFILAAMFASYFMRFFSKFRKHLGLIEKIMGGLLVLFGTLILTDQISRIAQWLLETFPQFASSVAA